MGYVTVQSIRGRNEYGARGIAVADRLASGFHDQNGHKRAARKWTLSEMVAWLASGGGICVVTGLRLTAERGDDTRVFVGSIDR